MSALKDEGIILYRRADGPGVQDVLFSAFVKTGFRPRVVADVSRLLSAVTLVAAGKGIAIVPENLRSLHRESVIYRELDAESDFTVPLTLVYRLAQKDSLIYRFVELANEKSET